MVQVLRAIRNVRGTGGGPLKGQSQRAERGLDYQEGFTEIAQVQLVKLVNVTKQRVVVQ
jgi:hypothetical protein